jgi:hypothetical protein
MAQRWWGLSLALSLAAASTAGAQVRELSGRVTNSQTTQGVAEATIASSGPASSRRRTTRALSA